ncbi:hypothetical protein KCU89_g83, partial [Aureobasidium melanogenum]
MSCVATIFYVLGLCSISVLWFLLAYMDIPQLVSQSKRLSFNISSARCHLERRKLREEHCLKIYGTTDVKRTPHWDLRRHAVALQASFVPNPEAF